MKQDKTNENLKSRPALTLVASETENIALAINEAKRQLMNHTASSQVIVHYLRLGTVERELELEKMRRENELLEAKTKSIRDSARSSESSERALAAFKRYSGNFSVSDADIDIYGDKNDSNLH